MKKAKIVHDNLNACGGSERLAFAIIELLNKHGFKVDLSTLQKPDMDRIVGIFGEEESKLRNFDQIDFLNINTILDLEKINGPNIERNKEGKKINSFNTKLDDKDYDIIINTHGDLFPYYNKLDCEEIDSKNGRSPIRITYCHYPLVPYFINKKEYSFLERFIDSFNELPPQKKDMIASRILEKYHEMMKNTIVLTNSEFSKHAIEKIYGKDKIKVTVVYPPVEINKFRTMDTIGDYANTFNSIQEQKGKILVISRISPSKNIENILEIGKILKESYDLDYFEINIVGSITPEDNEYAQNLETLILRYNLDNNIKINPNVSFQDLQTQVKESKLYLHPTPEEPFGISIVEAMSAGLIPIVPDKGGGTEFVPPQYHYSTIEDASNMIYNILKNDDSKHSIEIEIEKQKIKKLANKFSKQKFNENLIKVFESLFENNPFSHSLSSQSFVALYPRVNN